MLNIHSCQAFIKTILSTIKTNLNEPSSTEKQHLPTHKHNHYLAFSKQSHTGVFKLPFFTLISTSFNLTTYNTMDSIVIVTIITLNSLIVFDNTLDIDYAIIDYLQNINILNNLTIP